VTALRIRDARPDERDEAAALTRRAYAEIADVMTPTTWSAFERAMNAALADPGGAERIVADDGGRLVGTVLLYPARSIAHPGGKPIAEPEFRLLAVSPDMRGRGVARALVHECSRRAKAAGSTTLTLHTSKSFAAAVALYAAMGFARAPELDFHPEGAELVQGYRLRL
jgi:GNAT superfamily N-acetyltransferase